MTLVETLTAISNNLLSKDLLVKYSAVGIYLWLFMMIKLSITMLSIMFKDSIPKSVRFVILHPLLMFSTSCHFPKGKKTSEIYRYLWNPITENLLIHKHEWYESEGKHIPIYLKR